MSIRGTFPDSIDLVVTIEYDKGDIMQICTVLGHVYQVTFERMLWNRLCRHLSNYFSGVHNYENTKAMRVIFFSKRSKFELDFKKVA